MADPPLATAPHPDSTTPDLRGSLRDRGNGHADNVHGHGPAGIGTRGDPSPSSSPPSMTDSPDREHGIRVDKRRKAGGFLLHSALRHSGENKHARNGDKGKEKASARSFDSLKASPQYNGRVNGAMKSSPLSQVVVSPRAPYGDGTPSLDSIEGYNRPGSEASGSTSRTSADQTLRDDGDVFGQQHLGGIDPAQIVNMALNLSESRRRNVSAGQLLHQQGGGPRRAASTGVPPPAMIHGSYQNASGGGSLRQYLNQQRQVSRNHSPGSPNKPFGRQTSSHYAQAHHDPSIVAQSGLDYSYKFSPSTLARAEKARQHIELSVEFRRLLQYLPRLKPDGSSVTNLSVHSHTGVSNIEPNRALEPEQSRYQLGRNYNPLQLIRNRKARARTRSILNPDVEQWNDPGMARDWIDEVQDAATRPGYQADDRVRLPLFPDDGTSGLNQDFSPGHRKEELAGNLKRPRNDWHISPAELLADAYWLEQPGNKLMVENRHGTKMFPASSTAEALPRVSHESRRSFHGSAGTAGSFEPSEHGHDVQHDSWSGRKNRVHRQSRDESRGRLKHVWHKARGKSRSPSSGLSSSDDEGVSAGRQKRIRRVKSNEDNTGPLERHMDRLLDKAAQGRSPELVTPGTPNKWGTNVFRASALEQHDLRDHAQSDSDHVAPNTRIRMHKRRNGHFSPVQTHRKAGADGLTDPRSSVEYEDSTNPNSPVLAAHIPNIDLSPAGSRTASPARVLRKPLLPFIRTEPHRGHLHQSSIDESDEPNSRHTSGEVNSNPRDSLDYPSSPGRRRHFFHHKPHENPGEVLSQPANREKDYRDSREPESAVRRFFKGGRLGEIVRNEGSKIGSHGRKRDSPQEASTRDEFYHTDTDSLEESDTEGTDAKAETKPPPLVRSKYGSTRRYHLDNLPAFRSTNANKIVNSQANIDHISRQKRELERNRSSRFDLLAPPNLDLSRVTTNTTSSSNLADVSRSVTENSLISPTRRDANGFVRINSNRSRVGTRLAAILDAPGQVGRGGLPATALSAISSEKPPPRPDIKDKRQWSISDNARSRSRDPREPFIDLDSIARVEALLICSGVKASQIGRRALQHREYPAFLRRASIISKSELRSVQRSEEHVLAARMLTTHLENETQTLQADVEKFMMSTVQTMKKDLDNMKDDVNACIKSAQDAGDGCVGFGSEVTGQRTLQVRQVVDQLEKLVRSRRRRLRWIRRIGFGLVEWTVVLFMWWIWLIVMIFKLVFGSIRCVIRVVKWVFWL